METKQLSIDSLPITGLEILVVEDKEKHLERVEELKQAGHKVDVARTYREACDKLEESVKNSKPYDVVLSDMMFPFGRWCSSNDGHSEAPLGYALTLYASRCGVKAVAIVTDMNHHSNAVAATFDTFEVESEVTEGMNKGMTFKSGRMAFNIDGTTVVMFDARDFYGPKGYDETDPKNWPAALERIQKQGLLKREYKLN